MHKKSKKAVATRRGSPAVPQSSARRLSPGDRRAQILRVVAELFAKRPYPEIGVADVAKAAGITEGLVYHYFESRIGLFAAAVEASCAELQHACTPSIALPIADQVEQGVRGYLDYVEAHRVAYLNLFRGPAAHEPAFVRIIDFTRSAIIEHMIAVLGVAPRALPVLRLSLRGYIGYVEAAVLDWLEHGDVPRDTLEKLICAMVPTALASSLALDPDRLAFAD